MTPTASRYYLYRYSIDSKYLLCCEEPVYDGDGLRVGGDCDSTLAGILPADLVKTLSGIELNGDRVCEVEVTIRKVSRARKPRHVDLPF
jgi:hypothetical protein